ncbi:MAG: methylenetetrahydrofolate reductase [NAD(P)H] [Bacteroidetes bacterium]|nr:methylenetetrahydrofolate reductase [NAD(P)H] [Bacteroidota bacterium]MBK9800934.1 methylenetetrahydrofolate reductase [NAD(P)H] [Bacteroidota bacterium]
MKVTEHISKSKSTLFSFEILPPIKGKSIDSIYQSIDPLIDFKPSFINVTYHREEYVYKKRSGGYLEKVFIRKRPGTVGICAAIINKYKTDALPHLICGGFSKEETENALIDLQYLGIDNVLALRGDPIKTEQVFIPEPDGNKYAVDLVKQIVELNNGAYLDEEMGTATPTEFCIGVAGYPEKHFEAPNLQIDLLNLKAKVDAGADFVITQLFYDNAKFFEFVKAAREMGIQVPIIPGLKPMTLIKQTSILPKIFSIDIPFDLAHAFSKAQSDEAAREIGIEWSINQSKELIKFGVPCLHYYTMGKSEAVRQIAKAVF